MPLYVAAKFENGRIDVYSRQDASPYVTNEEGVQTFQRVTREDWGLYEVAEKELRRISYSDKGSNDDVFTPPVITPLGIGGAIVESMRLHGLIFSVANEDKADREFVDACF